MTAANAQLDFSKVLESICDSLQSYVRVDALGVIFLIRRPVHTAKVLDPAARSAIDRENALRLFPRFARKG